MEGIIKSFPPPLVRIGLTCLPKKLWGRVSSVSLTYVATTLLLSTVLVIKVSTKAIETGILLFIVDIKKTFICFEKRAVGTGMVLLIVDIKKLSCVLKKGLCLNNSNHFNGKVYCKYHIGMALPWTCHTLTRKEMVISHLCALFGFVIQRFRTTTKLIKSNTEQINTSFP